MFDKYEFRGVLEGAQALHRKVGAAISERLAAVEESITTKTASLANAKQKVADLPVEIANLEVERARLRALRPSEALRMALDEFVKPEPTP